MVPNSEGNRGYVPFGGERAVGARVADLKEFFHIGQDRPAAGTQLWPNAFPPEDINLITLLAEGSTGGLELQRRDGSWMPVRSLNGQLVINAGDMLQRATHGRLRSTTHRVSNPVGPNVS